MLPRHGVGRTVLSLASAALWLTVAASTATAEASGWTILPSPSPQGSPYASLVSVSCRADGRCVAVGRYAPVQGGEAPLAESFDGSSWDLEFPPTPSGASYAELDSVSCSSIGTCMAVGFSISGSSVKPLIEESSAGSWGIVSAPRPAGSFWGALESVSCPGRDCIAVGGFIKNGVDAQEQPLSERWNGKVWSLIPTLNLNAENGSSLDSVSCTSARSCEAAGSLVFADVVENVFAYGWNGNAWTLQHQQNPVGGQANADFGISCGRRSSCTSVGSWQDNESRIRALVESWDGGSWSREPFGNPPGFEAIDLSGVSCRSSDCVAVGAWATSLNGYPTTPLAERRTGGTWAIESTPTPPGAFTTSLRAVDCSSPTLCVAVGGTSDGTVTRTLVETSSR